jgi:hypothetical protein
LAEDANRLIRWQGWLDVDAFSVSVLNQMQKKLESDVNAFTGSFDITEPAIAEAVMKARMEAKANGWDFEMNPNLEEGVGANFENTPILYVWTYRHNFTDSGLYQLYVSVKGKMDIGTMCGIRMEPRHNPPVRYPDIQALNYEFSGDDCDCGCRGSTKVPVQFCETVFANVEIWRGAVAKVNSFGELEIVGNAGGVIPDYPDYTRETVKAAPMCDWEHAPSLLGNPNYNPKAATGAAFVEPLERAISINGNAVQKRAGDVQSRVRTRTPFRYR